MLQQARLGQQTIEKEALRLRTLLPGEWDLIAVGIPTGAAASITFSSLPQNFRTLCAIIEGRNTAASEFCNVRWRANGDTGNNYDWLESIEVGNNTRSTSATIATSSAYVGVVDGGNARANNFSPAVCYWPGYARTDAEKWSIASSTRFGNVSATSDMKYYLHSGRWRSVAAITSLTIFTSSGNLDTGGYICIYGVL